VLALMVLEASAMLIEPLPVPIDWTVLHWPQALD
jgi:hypothetical protein